MELDENELSWFFQNHSFSEWALQRIISDTMVGGAKYRAVLESVSEAAVASIKQRCPLLGFPKQLWYNYSLYGGTDAILFLAEPFLSSSEYWLNLGARSQAALDFIVNTIPADWRRVED